MINTLVGIWFRIGDWLESRWAPDRCICPPPFRDKRPDEPTRTHPECVHHGLTWP